MSVSITAQTKRGLVIGIGEQQDTCWAKINGDNDARYVKKMLERNGYKDICTLINRQATKKNIASAFNRLTRKCKAGDVVYIHFSGHGQQVRDLDGDEQDFKDESWIPYDAYAKYNYKKDRGDKHLIDDEVNNLLSNIKRKIGVKGKMLVVVDACHSGDSSRGDDEVTRGAYGTFMIPGKKQTARVKRSEKWLTLSACRDNEFCQEMKNPKVGILTYALYCLSQEGHADIDGIKKFVYRKKGNKPQTPLLSGETTRYNISDFIKR